MINKILGFLATFLGIAFLGSLYKGARDKNQRLQTEIEELEQEAEALSRINEAVVGSEKEFREKENEIKSTTASISRLRRKRVL